MHFCGTISHEDFWLKETLEGYGVGTSELSTSKDVKLSRDPRPTKADYLHSYRRAEPSFRSLRKPPTIRSF